MTQNIWNNISIPYVGKFMLLLRTKFQNSDVLLVIVVKPKAKENFRTAAVSWLYNLQKNCFHKGCISLIV